MAGKLTTSEPVRTNLPQFTLRTLFLAITCLGVAFALLETIGMAASCALLVGGSLIGLHVAGNVLGTTLRDNAPIAPEQKPDAPLNHISPETFNQLDRRSVSSLYRRARLGPSIYLATAAGAIAGGIVGDLFLMNFAHTSIRGLILGAASSGVLGGFFGFLYGCFLRAWLGAWWQASSESDDCQRRRAASSAPRTTANLPPPATP
jgi:hypothetical protein